MDWHVLDTFEKCKNLCNENIINIEQNALNICTYVHTLKVVQKYNNFSFLCQTQHFFVLFKIKILKFCKKFNIIALFKLIKSMPNIE